MIQSVTVTNYLGESLTMGIGSPDKSGLLITNIDGIGPGNATINTTEVSTMDGSVYNSSRIQERNIVIDILYCFIPTIEDARHKTYRYFPIKKPVTLTFETDTRTSQITGYVESNEPSIFEEESSTSISIICPDPYFQSPDMQITKFSNVIPAFEFPFENESLSDPTLIMSELMINYEKVINYLGEADTGMIIRMHVLGIIEMITLYNIETRESMKIDTKKIASFTGQGVSAGDDIIISTIKGSKYVTLLRNGVETNILNCLDRNVDWLQLTIGDNILAYTTDKGAENLQIEIYNPVLYTGV